MWDLNPGDLLSLWDRVAGTGAHGEGCTHMVRRRSCTADEGLGESNPANCSFLDFPSPEP